MAKQRRPGSVAAAGEGGSGGARVDSTDEAIIVALQRDGRMPYTKLSEIVGLSEPAVRQRVRRLLADGVMQIVAVTDPLELGSGVMALIGITADGDTREVADAIADLDESIYVVAVSGSFDVLVEVVCRDHTEFLSVLNEKIRSLPAVTATESFLYLDFFKHSFSYGVP